MADKMTQKINKEYICQWCFYRFKAWVGYSQGETSVLDNRKGKKSSLSTQVKCPNCLKLIPTWERLQGVKIRR